MQRIANIWLVDDDPNVIDIVQRAFQRQQLICQIRAFDDSSTLLAEMDRQVVLPNLLTVDYYLPTINGLDLIEHLRDSPKTASLRTVLFSQNLNAEIVAKAHRLDVYQVAPKPKSYAEWLVFAEELCLAGCFS